MFLEAWRVPSLGVATAKLIATGGVGDRNEEESQ